MPVTDPTILEVESDSSGFDLINDCIRVPITTESNNRGAPVTDIVVSLKDGQNESIFK
jgi:hypothetical protein